MVNINPNLKRGEELNQLSRLLFDSAAVKWYWAFLLELLAGIIALVFSLVRELPDNLKIVTAAIGVVLIVTAYLLRQIFDDQYDMAETMRRQSVLTEGLGYDIKPVMFSEWRRRAGSRILSRFTVTPRNADYYVTKKRSSPARLLEMTQESAFWTRFLYSRLLELAKIPLIIFILIVLGVILSIILGAIPTEIIPTLSYAVFLFIPIVITSNVIGWILKLRRLIASITEIENDIDTLSRLSRVDAPSVLRLISEYNCQVVSGFPIPSFVFKSEYSHIQDEWNKVH